MTHKSVVIDTDPGIDDAVAILFAVQSKQFHICAITTVAGNIGIDTVSRNAGRILALCKSDIPVYRGAACALKRKTFNAADVHGDDGLGGVPFPEPDQPAAGDAVARLAELLENEPSGSIEILTLGPLTNIAQLILSHPKTAARIGRLVSMGGAVDVPGNVSALAEFNFACDPEAAAIVFSSGIEMVLVPLDVTRKVRADLAYCAMLKSGSPAAKASGDLIGAYFQTTKDHNQPESRPLHDPCVMLYHVAPALFEMELRMLDIDISDSENAGSVIPGPHPIKVAMNVNTKAVLELLASGLNSKCGS